MHTGPRLLAWCSAFAIAAALGASSPATADESLGAAGFNYRVTPGKDLPGGDFLGTFATNEVACATYCSSDARCVAYTYLSPAPPSGGPSCWLKSMVNASAPLTEATSGVRIGLHGPTGILYGVIRGTNEPGVDRPGGDYVKIPLTSKVMRPLGLAPNLSGVAKAAAACSQLCDRDARCRAMTVLRAGVQGPSAVCFLKDSESEPVPYADAHSSVKLGPPPMR